MVLVMTVEPGFGGQSFIDSALDTVLEADEARRTNGWTWRLEVDGGVDPTTVTGCARNGADRRPRSSAVTTASRPCVASSPRLLQQPRTRRRWRGE